MYILTKIILTLTIITNIYGKNCDESGVLIYEDLGCTPHYKDNSTDSCPTEYSCPSILEEWTTSCYFKGKSYKMDESVPLSESQDPCAHCTCGGSSKFKFHCSLPGCALPKLSPNCRMKYSLDTCCVTEQICPPFAECEVDGKKYLEEEKFYPSNTCLECLCQKGFKLEEPFCRRKVCGAPFWYGDEIQGKCAPLYRKSSSNLLCCPDAWICPNDIDGLSGDKNKDERVGCHFGDVVVEKGHKINKSKFFGRYGQSFENIQCECLIPPLLTCREI